MGGGGPVARAQEIVKDPVRTVAAVSTLGQSEGVYEAKNQVKKAMNPNIPGAALAADPFSPTSGDAATKAKTETDLTGARDAERKARGRASTLLTGGGGVSDAGLSVSRRTLLGS